MVWQIRLPYLIDMADGIRQLRDRGFAEESRITRAAARLGIQQPHIHVRATLETSKLSSNIWKRVTTSPVIVRMIANCVAIIRPVALIRVRSAPTIAARLSLVRMSSTSKATG